MRWRYAGGFAIIQNMDAPLHIAGLDLGQTTDFSALCLNTRYLKMTPADAEVERQRLAEIAAAEEKKKCVKCKGVGKLQMYPSDPPEKWLFCSFCQGTGKTLPSSDAGINNDHLRPAETWAKKPESGGLTQALELFRAGDAEFDRDLPLSPEDPAKEALKRHYACRALKRWHLGTSYVEIVDDVRRLDKRLDNMVLVVDNTGVGRPVVDMFRRAKLRCRVVPVTITGGAMAVYKPHEDEQTGEFRVPKVELISAIQVVLQTRRIRFIEGMPEVTTLINEMREYRVKVTAAANETFNAREGAHDDLVLGAALSLWWGEKSPMRFKAW